MFPYGPCVSDESFARMLAGKLSEKEKIEVAEHTLVCLRCRIIAGNPSSHLDRMRRLANAVREMDLEEAVREAAIKSPE